MSLSMHGTQYGAITAKQNITRRLGLIGYVITIKIQRKMPRFTLCSVALTTAIAR